MGGPYRIDARPTALVERPSRAAVVGLSLGTAAFAICALAWVISRIESAFLVAQLWPGHTHQIHIVLGPYPYVVDVAFIATAAICSWKPMPGTRSHLAARIGLVAYVSTVLLAWWPVRFDPSAEIVSQPRSVLFLVLALHVVAMLAISAIPIEASRKYSAPRWIGILATATGVTFVSTLHPLPFAETRDRLAPFWRADIEVWSLVQFVLLAAAFGVATHRARFTRSIPAIAGEVAAPPKQATDLARAWIASRSGAVGVALAFAIACFAGEAAVGLLNASSVNDGAVLTGSVASLAGCLVLFGFARRASRAQRTLAALVVETMALGAALATAASALMRSRGHADIALTLRAVAIAPLCIAALATCIRIATNGSSKDRGSRRAASYFAGAVLVLAFGAIAGTLHGVTTKPIACQAGELVRRAPLGACFSEMVALVLALLAVRQLDRIDSYAKLVISADDHSRKDDNPSA